VTLNGEMALILHYYTEFVYDVVVKQLLGLPRFRNLLLVVRVREIAYENGRISDLQGLVALTLDRIILHTVVHQSSTSTYIPNFIEIEETFFGRTDGHLRPTLLGPLA